MGYVVNLKGTKELLLERTEGLKRYFHDVYKFPILTKEEEEALFNVYHNGTPIEKKKAKDKLINCNQRFVIGVAKRYGTNNNIMELISEGNLGLLEALDSFDPSQGVKFITWAVYFIRRQINRYNVDYGSIVKKTNNSKTYHLLAKATNDFVQKEHREPTSDEIFDLLNDKYDAHIKDARDITPTHVNSIDEGFNTEDDDTNLGDTALYNAYSASGNSYEETVEEDYAHAMISSLISTLSPREQKILTMAYGIGFYREYTNAEIAEEVGLTTERVRQMKDSLTKKLQTEYFKRLNTINNL